MRLRDKLCLAVLGTHLHNRLADHGIVMAAREDREGGWRASTQEAGSEQTMPVAVSFIYSFMQFIKQLHLSDIVPGT